MNRTVLPTVFSVLFIVFFSITNINSQTVTADFATWKDNKKAAYSIVHDDYTDYVQSIYIHGDAIATPRGIKLTFGAITKYCGPVEWANARTMIAHGHECINHTHTHLCGGTTGCSGNKTYGSSLYATELGLSTQLIEQNTGVRPTFFINPFDASSPAVISYLVSLGYIGTRSGTQEIVNGANFTNFLNMNFHVNHPTTPVASLNQAVDQAIQQGGYVMRELHGIGDDSYGSVSVLNYTNHLDYVKTQMDNGNIWSATASEAITYKMQRDAFSPVVTPSDSGRTLTVSFTTLKTLNTSVLKTPITVNVNLLNGTNTYYAVQNGIGLPVTKVGNRLSVNAYPHKGDVVFICSDCVGPILPEVALKGTPKHKSVNLVWNTPEGGVTRYLVVAQQGNGFYTKPPKDSTYTANSNFLDSSSTFEGGKVVYQGLDTALTVTNLTPEKNYFFRVYVGRDGYWSNGSEISSIPLDTVFSDIGCLKASYFNNLTLTGTPALTRYEASVNYNWLTASPESQVKADSFSVRWTGTFVSTETGNFKFSTNGNDGVRLWVKDTLIIDKWKDRSSAKTYSGYVTLEQGKTYNIKLEYYDKKDNASISLSWQTPTKAVAIMPFLSKCVGVTPPSAPIVNSSIVLGEPDAQLEKENAEEETKSSEIKPLKINSLTGSFYTIFPNPAQNYINVDLSAAEGKTVDIRIFSIIGKEIQREKIEFAQSTSHNITLKNFEIGQYIVQINVEGQRPVTQKLVINR